MTLDLTLWELKVLKVNAVPLADQVHKDLVDRKVPKAYPSRNLENQVLMDLLVRKVPRDNLVYPELMVDKVLRESVDTLESLECVEPQESTEDPDQMVVMDLRDLKVTRVRKVSQE